MIPSELPHQMVDIYQRLAEIERRMRNRRRTGTIKEGPDDQGRYRVLLSESDGKEYLSGWIKPRPLGAGIVKMDVVLKQGEQVDVVSESGDLMDARIEMSDYSDNNKRENTTNTPLHIKVEGDVTVIASGNSKVEVGGNMTANVGGNLDVTAGSGHFH